MCNDQSYYIGVTNNLDLRLKQHNQEINRNCYTYTRLPVKLVYHEIFDNPSSAIAFEKKLKGWTRRKKEALINNNFELLKILSKKYKSAQSLRQAQTDNTQI